MWDQQKLHLYFSRYAEDYVDWVPELIKQKFAHVVAVPFYTEPIEHIQNFLNFFSEIKVPCLMVMIVNATEQSNSHSIVMNNNLINWLEKNLVKISEKNNACLYKTGGEHQLLRINCSCKNYFLPVKQGVGLARKIICDIAAKLQYLNIIQSPWIHSTDADVLLPKDYFTQVQTLTDAAVGIYNYQHRLPTTTNQALALQLYQFTLDYYYAGLAFVDSPYAWPAIGSTLAIHYQYYAKVRGFPQRLAGEDFYLLNKISKIGKVSFLTGQAIELSSRCSKRTPFGTGRAIEKIMALSDPLNDYLYYHPCCFICLNYFFQCIEDKLTLSQFLVTIPKIYRVAVLAIFERFLQDCPSFQDGQFHVWFDGLKTLRCLHFLRDHFFASVNLRQLSKLLKLDLAKNVIAK